MTSFEFFLHTAELLLLWATSFIVTLVVRNIKRIEARMDKLEASNK